MNTAPRRLDLRRKLFDLVERFERFQNGGQKSLADRCQREASRRAPENYWPSSVSSCAMPSNSVGCVTEQRAAAATNDPSSTSARTLPDCCNS